MIRRHMKWIPTLFVLFGLTHLAVAEVGMVTSTDLNQRGGPYQLTIIEDGDPVTATWTRYTLSSNRYVLNESGAINGDGLPAILFDPASGLRMATWGKNTGSGFDVVESHFENGAWTTPAIVAGSVTMTIDPEPSIVLNKQNGTVHIVYVASDAAPVVYHTHAPTSLSSWATPVPVSGVGQESLRPSAVFHQGVLKVAYEFHTSGVGSSPRQIMVATADGIGGFTYETITTSYGTGPNRPALHVGGATSVWLEWIDGENEMAWSTWEPTTGWDSPQIEMFIDVEDRDFFVRGRVKHLATQ
jgi:hypothetical protein